MKERTMLWRPALRSRSRLHLCFAEPASPEHRRDRVFHALSHQVQRGFGAEVHVCGRGPGYVRILQVIIGVSSCPLHGGVGQRTNSGPMWSKSWSLPGTAPGPHHRLATLLLNWEMILQGQHEIWSGTQGDPTTLQPGLGHPSCSEVVGHTKCFYQWMWRAQGRTKAPSHSQS